MAFTAIPSESRWAGTTLKIQRGSWFVYARDPIEARAVGTRVEILTAVIFRVALGTIADCNLLRHRNER